MSALSALLLLQYLSTLTANPLGYSLMVSTSATIAHLATIQDQKKWDGKGSGGAGGQEVQATIQDQKKWDGKDSPPGAVEKVAPPYHQHC